MTDASRQRAAYARNRDILGREPLRLYAGEKLQANIAGYGRQGYALERIEALADRNLVHMVKHLQRGTTESILDR